MNFNPSFLLILEVFPKKGFLVNIHCVNLCVCVCVFVDINLWVLTLEQRGQLAQSTGRRMIHFQKLQQSIELILAKT